MTVASCSLRGWARMVGKVAGISALTMAPLLGSIARTPGDWLLERASIMKHVVLAGVAV